MKAWKRLEKKVAQEVGGRRTSRPWADLPDVESDWLVAECKHRKSLPKWLKDALAQAKRYAGPSQLPIVVLHERYQRDSMVLLSLKDFTEWFCNGEVPGTELPEQG